MNEKVSVDSIISELHKANQLEQLNLFMESIPSICFKRCITKPGKIISNLENVCF